MYRSAMEVFRDAQHYGLVLWDPFDLVAPFPRNLYGCFHRLRSGVHGQDHVKPKVLGHELGEFGEDIVVEGSGAQGQSARLLG